MSATDLASDDRSASQGRLSNWAGFVFFVTLAVYTLITYEIGVALLPTLVLEGIVALSFLIRRPSRTNDRRLAARTAAYVGTFLPMIFIQAAGTLGPELLTRTTSPRMLGMGLVFWSMGLVMSVVSLWNLRRAFSIEPAARELVTTGPYRFARHPVYTGYILNYIGTWCFFPSAPLLLMLIGWLMATLLRVRYEEAVLTRAFPEDYAAYRSSVGAFAPHLRLSPPRERHSSPRATP